jgi:hypothetical protein
MINEQDFLDAISALKPDAPFQIVGTDYSTLIILDDSKKPSLADIENKMQELSAEKFNMQTQRATQKTALLTKLGITEDEARLLLS